VTYNFVWRTVLWWVAAHQGIEPSQRRSTNVSTPNTTALTGPIIAQLVSPGPIYRIYAAALDVEALTPACEL
jgi:hypothetical protein